MNTKKDTFYISKEAILGEFLEQCRKLQRSTNTKIVMGDNTVTVYKNEDDDKLYDVFFFRVGKKTEDNDHYEKISENELDDLVGRFLIQGYEAEQKNRLEVDTAFGKLFAEVNGDADYPGISICMETNDEEHDTTFERQFALMECTPDVPKIGGHSLRLLVWNSDHDDYTDDFTFLEEIPNEDETKEIIWRKYQRYLHDWADSHSGPEFYGMTPACFDEWRDSEN